MSQYPPPYSPQQPPYGGFTPPPPYAPPRSPEELLAPARRAGVTMIVLGVLAVLFGLCLAFMGTMFDNPEFTSSPQYAQMQQQFQQVERELGIPVQRLFVIMGAVPLAIGAILGALGFGVRGGSRGVAIGAIVFVALLLALLGVVMLGGLVQLLASGGRPDMLLGMCVYGVPFVLLIFVTVWLVQAVRAAGAIEAAQRNYHAQMWQYQQQQQAYLRPGQPPAPSQPGPTPSGMGYHVPPPPQTPAAPPPEPKDPPDGPPAAG